MANRDRSVRFILDATVTGFVTGMGTASQAAVGFATKAGAAIDRNQAAMNSLAGTSLKLGLGLTALAGFAVKSAMDWETAWAGVTKTVSGTESQMASLEQGLRDLATSMPESHQEIAAVAEAAGQLGIARENIVGFTKVMVMLGDSTNLSSEEAATSIAQLMNIMGTAPQNVGRLGAALVQLGNNGASTEKQIIEMAQRIAGAGRIVGLSEQNVLGLASAVASTGIEVEAGGTAISQALISATTAVATNSAQLQVWADTAGMSAKKFSQAWENDPAAAFLAFEQGLNKQGKKAFVTLNQLGLDGARVGRVLVNLAGANRLLGASFADADEAWRKNTALINEAEKRYDTAAAKGKIAWNQIKDAGIDAGNGLLPVVSAIAESIGGMAGGFRELDGFVKGALTSIVGVTGVTLLGVGAFIKLAGAVRGAGAAMGLMKTSEAAGGVLGAGTAGLSAAAIGFTVAVLAFRSAAGALSSTSVTSVEDYTKAILRLADGGKEAEQSLSSLAKVRFAGDGFGNLIKNLDDNALSRFVSDWADWVNLGWNDDAQKQIAAMDDALTNMVESGNLEAANDGFQQFAAAAEKEGKSIEWAESQFPNYIAALEDSGKAAAKAKAAFSEAAGGSDMLGRRLQELGTDPDKAIEALRKMQSEARESSRAFSGFYDSLKEGGGSWEAWKKNLKEGIKATADFNKNITNLTLRGVPDEWINKWQAAPEKYASLVAAMADATDSELRKIVAMYFDAGTEIADGLDTIPQDVRVSFSTVGTEESMRKLAELVVLKTDLSDEDVRFYLEALGTPEDKIKHVLELIAEYERQHPEVVLGANTDPAVAELQGFFSWLEGGAPDPTLDIGADTTSGETSLTGLLTLTDDSGADINAGADTKGGKKDVKGLKDKTDNTKANIKVGANTDPARAALARFVAYAMSQFAIHLPIFGSGGSAMGMRIPTGFAAGGRVPGTPPADPLVDNVMGVGMNSGRLIPVRSREWIVNEKSSDENDNWLRAINNGLNLNKVFGPVPLRGFVQGGRATTATAVGRPAPSGGGTQLVSFDLTGMEFDLDPQRGLGRFVRGQAQIVLEEERQGRQQNLTRKILRA